MPIVQRKNKKDNVDKRENSYEFSRQMIDLGGSTIYSSLLSIVTIIQTINSISVYKE